MEERFCLTRDEDGHWYVIPADKREECERHFEAVYRYWGKNEGILPDDPDWLKPLGGSYSLLTFSNPIIE